MPTYDEWVVTGGRDKPSTVPAKVNTAGKEKNRAKHIRATMGQFGYGPEKYEAMLRAQGGKCAICGYPPSAGYLVIDHDHVGGPNGRLRDLLCDPCNRALGAFRDSPENCEKAAAYLRHHRARHGRED